MTNIMTLQTAFMAIGVLFFLVMVLFVLLILQRMKTKRLLSGVKGDNLELVLDKHGKVLGENSKNIEAIIKNIEIIKEKNLGNYQKFTMKRFNPFKDIGGDQSFVMVMLDGHNNGFVVSSLYREDGARVYAKPIINGKSTYNLVADEKELLESLLK